MDIPTTFDDLMSFDLGLRLKAVRAGEVSAWEALEQHKQLARNFLG
jgi:hypothetical protein